MSQFSEFNAENKLRIPLSSFAAQTIENDCFSFAIKKTTLINAIILYSYKTAACSISLRIKEYRNELAEYSTAFDSKENSKFINRLIKGKAEILKEQYAKRFPSDVNWQITLNKEVKDLLTINSYSEEEKYYGQKPGHYVRALMEEYSQQPYYKREEIVFKPIFDIVNSAIEKHYILRFRNSNGKFFAIKPHSIQTDPLSMYHYLVGINLDSSYTSSMDMDNTLPDIISLRISRLSLPKDPILDYGQLSKKESLRISKELEQKGVQFLTSGQSVIQVRLSDDGIKKYETQAHLRPRLLKKDEEDDHLYYFDCTDTQILFYFWRFGKDARIISPSGLAEQFRKMYKDAYDAYK